MFALEDRIYFDGAAATTAATVVKDGSSSANANSNASTSSSVAMTSPDSAHSAAATSAGESSSASASATAAASVSQIAVQALVSSIVEADASKTASGKEILVVSSAAANASELESAAKTAGMGVVECNPATESLAQLLSAISSTLDGAKAKSITLVVADNGADGFTLVSGETVSTSGISTTSAFWSETAKLLADGGIINVSGDASLTANGGSALETALANVCGREVAFIDASDGTARFAFANSQDVAIYFIDASVQDASKLINELPSSAITIQLSRGGDGVQEIANYLATHSNIDSISIITHGADGAIVLGADLVNSDTLASTYASSVASWGKSLASDGSIAIYACDTAQDASGKAFVDRIATLTGHSVAASTDMTGANGNWILEYASSSALACCLDIEGYDHNLAAVTVAIDNGTGVNGTLSWAVANTVSGDTVTFGVGSVNYTGAASISIDKTLTINTSSGALVSLVDSSGGALFDVAAGGSLTLNNITLSGRVNGSGGALTDNCAGTLSLSGSFSSLTIDKGSGNSDSLATDLDATSLTLDSGSLSIGARTLTIAGLVNGGGSLTGGTSSKLTASGSLTLPSTALTLDTLTISSGVVSLGANLTLTTLNNSGELKLGAHTLALSAVTNWGTFTTSSSSNLTLNDELGIYPTLTLPSGLTLGTLTLNGLSIASVGDGATLNVQTLNNTSSASLRLGDGSTLETASVAAWGDIVANTSSNLIIDGSATLTRWRAGSSSITLNNVTVNSGTLTLACDLVVNGTLTLRSGGYLSLGSSANWLWLGANASCAASSSGFIITSGTGCVCKSVSNASTSFNFTFCIGSSETDYSPISVSGTASFIFGAGARITARVDATKPAAANGNSCISRYWSLTTLNISNYTATVTATYLASDVTGTASALNAQSSSDGTSWTQSGSVNTAARSTTQTLQGDGAVSDYVSAWGNWTPGGSGRGTNIERQPKTPDAMPSPSPAGDAPRLMTSDRAFSIVALWRCGANVDSPLPQIQLSQLRKMPDGEHSVSGRSLLESDGGTRVADGEREVSPDADAFWRKLWRVDELSAWRDFAELDSRFEKIKLFKSEADLRLDAIAQA